MFLAMRRASFSSVRNFITVVTSHRCEEGQTLSSPLTKETWEGEKFASVEACHAFTLQFLQKHQPSLVSSSDGQVFLSFFAETHFNVLYYKLEGSLDVVHRVEVIGKRADWVQVPEISFQAQGEKKAKRVIEGSFGLHEKVFCAKTAHKAKIIDSMLIAFLNAKKIHYIRDVSSSLGLQRTFTIVSID